MYHLTPDGMRRFRRFLLQYFDRIEIVGFVRSPVSFAQSYAQEALKHRNTLAHFLKSTPPTPKYEKRFGGYAEVFGWDNWTVLPFDRDSFPSGSSLKMFLKMIRAPEAEDLLADVGAETKNTSMSMQAAKILSLVNRDAREMEFRDYQARLLRPLMGLPGDRFQLSAEIADRVISESEADLDWLAANLDIRFAAEDHAGAAYPPQDEYERFSPEEIRAAMFALIAADTPVR